MPKSLLIVSLLAAALVVSVSGGFADTYTDTFTNSTAKQWIAWHVECPGKNSTPDFNSVDVYNTSAPSQKWLVYPFEQGSTFYQNNGFLAYPPEGADAQVDPGETLSVTFNYTVNTAPASFTQYEVQWPLDSTMVTVTPENMQGWSVATNKGAKAGLVKYGCAFYEANRGFISETDNVHLGRGTFYAALDYAGGPGTSGDGVQSSTAWLGTDTWNGQPLAGITLNRITKMVYYGFVSKEPTRQTGPPDSELWDSWNGWWIGPRDPICLELTAESPDGSDRVQFWFRPWNTGKVSGDNCRRQAQRWIRYDCINGTPNVQVTGRWYLYRPGWVPDPEWPGYEMSLDEVYWLWADLIAVYGNYKLVATSTTWDPGNGQYKSAGWDETTDPVGIYHASATGKCLNFQVGARKGYADIYGCDEPDPPYLVNWAGYYWGFRGHVDFFTLGIDGTDVTYDFEPSPTEPSPDIVSITSKTVDDPIMGKMVVGYNNAPVKVYLPVLDYYPVKITGKVTKVNNVSFTIEDGGALAMPVRVFLIRDNSVTYAAPRYTFPATGQYWSVWGFLEKPRFSPSWEKPWCLWTSYYNCQRIK